MYAIVDQLVYRMPGEADAGIGVFSRLSLILILEAQYKAADRTSAFLTSRRM